MLETTGDRTVIDRSKGDITRINDVSAIVNAANTSLLGGGDNNETELLADCYRNSLDVAIENGIRSVAFPSISTGGYSFPVDKDAQIAVTTVYIYLEEHKGMLDRVTWVLFDQATRQTYANEINNLPR